MKTRLSTSAGPVIRLRQQRRSTVAGRRRGRRRSCRFVRIGQIVHRRRAVNHGRRRGRGFAASLVDRVTAAELREFRSVVVFLVRVVGSPLFVESLDDPLVG
jgi:hypothetical protein